MGCPYQSSPVRVNGHPQSGWSEFVRRFFPDKDKKHVRAFNLEPATMCKAPGLSCKNQKPSAISLLPAPECLYFSRIGVKLKIPFQQGSIFLERVKTL